jgi:DnaJ-related protein SCJ1
LLGFERTLTHLDGRSITVRRIGTTQPGEVEVIEGEGVSLTDGLVNALADVR